MQELITQHEAEFIKLTSQIYELEERRKEIRTIIATLKYVEKESQNASQQEEETE